MRLIYYLIIILILAFPFGQLTSINFFWPPVRLYWFDLIILIILLFYRKIVIKQFFQHRYLIGFFVFACLSLLANSSWLNYLQLFISSLYLFRFMAYTCLLFVIKKVNDNDRRRLRPFINICILIALFIGMAQYLFFPKLEPLFAYGWDRHAYRLVGSWLDPNYTGLLYCLFIFYLLNQINIKEKLIHIWPKLFLILGLIIGLLLTYSRSTYLSFIIGMVIYFRNIKKASLTLIAVIIFLILIAVLPTKFGEGTKLLRYSTIQSRLNNWRESTELFLKQPILGYGFNSLRFLKPQSIIPSNSASGVDHSLLFLLTTTGVFGSMQLLLFYKSLLKESIKKPHVLISLVVILIHSLFINSWFYPWVLLWFYFMAAGL